MFGSTGPALIVCMGGVIKIGETWPFYSSEQFISTAHYVGPVGAPLSCSTHNYKISNRSFPTIGCIVQGPNTQGLVCLPGIKGSRKNENDWKIRNMIAVLKPALQMQTLDILEDNFALRFFA